MNPRARIAVPLVGGLLGAAWLMLALGTAPEVLPSSSAPLRVRSTPAPPPAVAWEPGTVRLMPPAPALAAMPREALPAMRAVPSPVDTEDGAAPGENEAPAPELPQTPEWRHGKLARITDLLGRDVTRLELERKSAQARGDDVEARRLEVQLSRHRARLGALREERDALARAAHADAREP